MSRLIQLHRQRVSMILVLALVLLLAPTVWGNTPENMEELNMEEVEEGKIPLTLEEAVAKATASSINLKTRANSLKQLEESRERVTEAYWDTRPDPGDNLAGPVATLVDAQTKNLVLQTLSLDINMRSASLQKTIDEERIVFTLQSLFNDIRETEENKALMENRLSHMNTLLAQEKLKVTHGTSSSFQLDQLTKEVEQLQKNMDILDRSLNNLYEQLGIFTGIRNIFDYQVVTTPMDYRPLSESQKTTYVSRALSNDPYLEIRGYEIEQAERDIQLFTYTGTGTPYAVKKLEVENATLRRNQTKQNLEEVMKKRITQLEQLEEQLEISDLKLEQLQSQMDVLTLRYELGMITRNELTEKTLELNNEKNNRENLQQQHALLRVLVEKPHLAPEYL